MSFTINTMNKTQSQRCKNCTHFIRGNNINFVGRCSCNFDFKFPAEKCNIDKFNDKEDIRKCHICFVFCKQINDNEIKYIDTGLGCIIENNCNDQEVIEKVKNKLLTNAKKMLKENNINIKEDIFPIIFAEKINGIWKQIFFGFDEEYSKILFNRLH